MCKKLIVLILVLGMTAGVANAELVALDDFSSGNESGGTGWGTDWLEYGGDPITMNFSTANPFNDNISDEYRSEYPIVFARVKRDLATPLLPSTTPEVWVGLYLRAVGFSDLWQFGMEVNNSDRDYLTWQGAQAGAMHGSPAVRLARGAAEGPVGDGISEFTEGQPTLLVMRIYKNSPTDELYNRADLYADLDGNDGRYNNEVEIYTGLDLAHRSASEISVIQLYQSGFGGPLAVDFDFVAVGTTKGDVPEPATIALLGLGGLALLRRKRR